ncbi:DUF3788 family protein [Pelagicoccus mobilis]|uniref:DUF3788 family protein n=1 Tax=Pelagicoccus mobilis TaxID=415221 RepID=A0A934S2S2_9BACT|nr:DUF3788 family protein [Pelagicoccus mobilis]MBK1878772.1 DUF3788 family protein [Pelagicoccus mobilis]
MKKDQLLIDPDVEPTSTVLEETLGPRFKVYQELVSTLESEEYGVLPEWRYYKDGGAWLCKMARKKKTVFWLSAWKTHLTCGFYFTAKTGEGVGDLKIERSIIEAFESAKPIGKLLPLAVDLKWSKQLADLYQIVRYKIAQK